MAFTPKILVVDNQKELRWLGKLLVPGLFDGEHFFKIEPRDDGTVDFVHGERFSGILAMLFIKQIAQDTENGFHAMNQALKSLSESTYGK